MRSRPDRVFCWMAGLTHGLPGVNGLFAPVPLARQGLEEHGFDFFIILFI